MAAFRTAMKSVVMREVRMRGPWSCENGCQRRFRKYNASLDGQPLPGRPVIPRAKNVLTMTRIPYILFFVLSLVALLPAAFGAEESPRRRLLLDANWRFYRGEVPGESAAPQGTPISHWRWIAVGEGQDRRGEDGRSGLDTSGARLERRGQRRRCFSWSDWLCLVPHAACRAHQGPGHVLHFECVDDNATVYLERPATRPPRGLGRPVRRRSSPAWKEGGPNDLAVLVENTDGAGGITAPVYLGRRTRAPRRARPLRTSTTRLADRPPAARFHRRGHVQPQGRRRITASCPPPPAGIA